MTLEYDLYWSFRSPYSYLITPRLLELEAGFDVRCHVRPVYPLAVRTPVCLGAACTARPQRACSAAKAPRRC